MLGLYSLSTLPLSTLQAIAAGLSAAIGQALEDNLPAGALSKSKIKELGQSLQEDLAQIVTRLSAQIVALAYAIEDNLSPGGLAKAKARGAGQALEDELSSVFARLKVKGLGLSSQDDLVPGNTTTRKARALLQALEDDLVIAALGKNKTVTPGLATQDDLVIAAMGRLKAKALGSVLEDDLVSAGFNRLKSLDVAQAIVDELGAAITRLASLIVALGIAVEDNTTFSATGNKTARLLQAIEAKAATVLGKAKAKALGQSVQADLVAGAWGRAKSRELLIALQEDMVAGALAKAKVRALGQAAEDDFSISSVAFQTIVHGVATCAMRRLSDIICRDIDTAAGGLTPSESVVHAPGFTRLATGQKLQELPGDGIDRVVAVAYDGTAKWHSMANMRTFTIRVRIGYFAGSHDDDTQRIILDDEQVITQALSLSSNWTDSCAANGTIYGYIVRPSVLTLLEADRYILELPVDIQVGR